MIRVETISRLLSKKQGSKRVDSFRKTISWEKQNEILATSTVFFQENPLQH